MKIQGSYTPPMGQSAYSNLKQNISTSAMQNGPEHSAKTIQKLDNSHLNYFGQSQQLAIQLHSNAWESDVGDLIRSGLKHLLQAFQGLEAFKEQQSILNPNLDLTDMDVSLQDGKLTVTGIKNISGEAASGNQVNAIKESLFDSEELKADIEYALSNLTKAINKSKRDGQPSFTTDINELKPYLESLKSNKENIVKNSHFSINGFIENYLEENPRRTSKQERREARRTELGFYQDMATPTKNNEPRDFATAMEEENAELYFALFIDNTGLMSSEPTKYSSINTKA